MSVSPEPPERLAEILLEILALSKPAPTSQSESVSGSNPIENFDAHRVEEQSEARNAEDDSRKDRSTNVHADLNFRRHSSAG